MNEIPRNLILIAIILIMVIIAVISLDIFFPGLAFFIVIVAGVFFIWHLF